MARKILDPFLLFLLFNSSINDFNCSGIKFDKKYVQEFFIDDELCKLKYIELYKNAIDSIDISIQEAEKFIENGDPGDFSKIVLRNKQWGKLEFVAHVGWITLDKQHVNPTVSYEEFYKKSLIKNPYFLYLDIGESNRVLIFIGWPDGTGSGLLTIINLKNDIPKVIFNQNVELLELVKNHDSYKLRVIFGTYESCANELLDKKGRMLPANLNGVSICDIYIKNNELIVEDLQLSIMQILYLINQLDAKTILLESKNSLAVATLVEKLIDDTSLKGLQANSMYDFLTSEKARSTWKEIKGPEGLQKLANEGHIIIAVWKNPISNKSGHVVCIIPGEEKYSGKWKCKVPRTMDAGKGNRWPTHNTPPKTLADGFGKEKKDSVKYFIFVGTRKN